MRQALFLLSALALVSCAPPGQQSISPTPAGPDTQTISAADAFQNRIPLVSILPDTQDFQGPLKAAVAQALAIKPDASFQVMAETPATGAPDNDAKTLATLAPQATAIANAIIADGVPAARVSAGGKTAGLDQVLLVYVK
ncbi:MAG: hypothetical protein KGH91_06275 [Rhodospirillales bacterium]|nr:hypothetical protein [Rhodospirillales bacterium]